MCAHLGETFTVRYVFFLYFLRGLEISSPLSDDDLKSMLHLKCPPDTNGVTNGTTGEMKHLRPRPWLDKSEDMLNKVDKRLSRIGAFFASSRRSTTAPTLNRFDGIRFHLKKRGIYVMGYVRKEHVAIAIAAFVPRGDGRNSPFTIST